MYHVVGVIKVFHSITVEAEKLAIVISRVFSCKSFVRFAHLWVSVNSRVALSGWVRNRVYFFLLAYGDVCFITIYLDAPQARSVRPSATPSFRPTPALGWLHPAPWALATPEQGWHENLGTPCCACAQLRFFPSISKLLLFHTVITFL